MRINIAQKHILAKILERKRKDEWGPEANDLKAILKEILTVAARFVPSESGSILFDDPVLTPKRVKPGFLYFVACFGKGSAALAGTALPATVGIVGKTYNTGRPYISKKAREDSNFYPAVDKKTKFFTRSIICAPIKIRKATIGVIELLNRLDGLDYTKDDLMLLKLFAEYTSTLIQNSLDARRFGELSIKDNLTGLYNDRFLYGHLSKEVARAVKTGGDLSVLFLDLDGFKEINDIHGHLAGSRVLTETGYLLKETLEGNAAAIRYGGDEFVVILPGKNLNDAGAFAERIRKAIETFVFLKKSYSRGEKALRISGQITCSVGVASLKSSCRGELTSPSDLTDLIIKKADAAMYASKQEGKNRVTLSASPSPSFQLLSIHRP